MTICKSCGKPIDKDQGIITNIAGAYHRDDFVCTGDAYIQAPVWGQTA